MSVTVKTTGLKELDKQVARLSKSMGKGALRKALRIVAEPVAEDMRAGAPPDPDGNHVLKPSIGVGTKLSKRQAGLHRKMFRNDKASVEMFVGAGPVSSATQQEFGNRRHGAQPFARPAWDAHKGGILDKLSAELWTQVEASIGRAAKRGKLLS